MRRVGSSSASCRALSTRNMRVAVHRSPRHDQHVAPKLVVALVVIVLRNSDSASATAEDDRSDMIRPRFARRAPCSQVGDRVGRRTTCVCGGRRFAEGLGQHGSRRGWHRFRQASRHRWVAAHLAHQRRQAGRDAGEVDAARDGSIESTQGRQPAAVSVTVRSRGGRGASGSSGTQLRRLFSRSGAGCRPWCGGPWRSCLGRRRD